MTASTTSAPTRPAWAAAVPSCDFCRAPLGTHRYLKVGCREFTRDTPAGDGAVRISYVGEWAACRRCAPLVETRRWRQLIDRVVACARAAGFPVDSSARHELAALYLHLERELTGTCTPARHRR